VADLSAVALAEEEGRGGFSNVWKKQTPAPGDGTQERQDREADRLYQSREMFGIY